MRLRSKSATLVGGGERETECASTIDTAAWFVGRVANRRRAAAVPVTRLLDRDAERLDARGERRRLHVQQLGGAAAAEHLAAAGFERSEDVGAVALAPLVVGQQPVGLRRRARRGACAPSAGRSAGARARRIAARSITFCSSRTLPGQSIAQAARVASVSRRSPLELAALRLCTKCAASSGMSSRRSRSGTRLDREHVEAEVEVFAKAPAPHLAA